MAGPQGCIHTSIFLSVKLGLIKQASTVITDQTKGHEKTNGCQANWLWALEALCEAGRNNEAETEKV